MSFYDIPGIVDSWSLKYVICACCILCERVRVRSVFVEEIEHDRAGQLTTAEITTARGALDVLEGLMADTTTGTDGGGPFFGGAARSTLANQTVGRACDFTGNSDLLYYSVRKNSDL